METNILDIYDNVPRAVMQLALSINALTAHTRSGLYTPENVGSAWSQADLQRLALYHAQGIGISAMAALFCRTEEEIVDALIHLGRLYKTNDTNPDSPPGSYEIHRQIHFELPADDPATVCSSNVPRKEA